MEHIHKRKPFLKPYESVDDERFEWLQQFLDYFTLWKESIDEDLEIFPNHAKANMFISHQTYEGLQTTVYSFIEVCKFLLQRGAICFI